MDVSIVVSNNSLPSPSGPITIDANGQATYSAAVAAGATLNQTFSFTHDASGGASFSGTAQATVSASGISVQCTLPFSGTRTSGGSGAVPTVDPTVLRDEGAAYHRIVSADYPLVRQWVNLDVPCSQPVSGAQAGVVTCVVANVTTITTVVQMFLDDISSVPVPPTYVMADTRLRQGLQGELAALKVLAKGGHAFDELQPSVGAYNAAALLIYNAVALLPA
jgi:hypothetical protein